MLKFNLSQAKLGYRIQNHFESTVLKGFDYIKAFVNLSIVWIILIESFKVIHCSIIKVPTLVKRLFFVALATRLFYQTESLLSRTFLNCFKIVYLSFYYDFTFQNCCNTFLKCFSIVAQSKQIVKNFFLIFQGFERISHFLFCSVSDSLLILSLGNKHVNHKFGTL